MECVVYAFLIYNQKQVSATHSGPLINSFCLRKNKIKGEKKSRLTLNNTFIPNDIDFKLSAVSSYGFMDECSQ